MKHQDQWLASVARFVMHQVYQLWILRNNERHGTTPAERVTRLRVTVERELEAMYACQTSCQPQHQAIFHADLTTHKKKSLIEIRNWLSIYSVTIKLSCKRQKDASAILPIAVT